MRLVRLVSLPGCLLATLLTSSPVLADTHVDATTVTKPGTGKYIEETRPTRDDMNLQFRSPLQTYAMRPRTVNERYIRDLDNGCDYVATIRGSIQPRDARNGEPTYRANLTLDAHVECAGHVRAAAPMYTLRAGRITGIALREALSSHGRVSAASGIADTCTYTPTYALVPTGIQTRNVWQACTVTPAAIGGGPRPIRK